jgi:hypothetical protein
MESTYQEVDRKSDDSPNLCQIARFVNVEMTTSFGVPDTNAQLGFWTNDKRKLCYYNVQMEVQW